MASVREGGRAPDALRPVEIVPFPLKHPLGSCLVAFGETRVLCAVTIDERLPAWLAGQGRGWVTAEYSLLPASTHTRTRRDSATGRPNSRALEIQRLIGRSLRAGVNLARLGETQFTVDCDVLQADGGTRTAAVTGGYVALALAVERLVRVGRLPADALVGPVAAVSVGLVGGEPRLDLDYEEDRHADCDINVVMDAQDRFIEVQGTAENAPFDRAQLDDLLTLAARGVAELRERQRQAIAEALDAAVGRHP